MYSIQYLCNLVEQKNELNRKRRRFWHLKRLETERIRVEKDSETYKSLRRLGAKMIDAWSQTDFSNEVIAFVAKPLHPAFSLKYAEDMYWKTCARMRRMTKHMRKVRTELSARFTWSDSWSILEVKHEGRTYKAADIKRLANEYWAEQALLS